MFVLTEVLGNCDGEFDVRLDGVYNELAVAQKAMAAEFNGAIKELGWERGSHELRERDAWAMDGDFFEHERYVTWQIFDSDAPDTWHSGSL